MAKQSSFGAKIQYLVTATWTDIAGIKDITGPGLSTETTDVTTHDSPSGWREHIGTLKDAGELTFPIEWDPENAAGQAYLAAHQALGDTITLHIVFNSASPVTWEIDCIVTKFEPTQPVSGSFQASLSLKLTGLPDFAWTA